MKDAFELLREKELQLSQIRKQIESLRIVAPLLAEDSDPAKEMSSEEENKDSASQPQEIEEEKMFSSVGGSGSRFWKIGRRSKE